MSKEANVPRQRSWNAALVSIPILAGVLIAACGGSGSASTPATVAGTASAGDGAAVYASSCASCHGANLEGTPRGPSHLSIVYEPSHHGDAAFVNAIANGAQQHHWNFGAMPPVAGLSAEDVDAVIRFIRDEQERQGFTRP